MPYRRYRRRARQSPHGYVILVIIALVVVLYVVGMLSTAISSMIPPPAPVLVPAPAEEYNRNASSPFSSGSYTITCGDGWVSHSAGKRGACSHHGGEHP